MKTCAEVAKCIVAIYDCPPLRNTSIDGYTLGIWLDKLKECSDFPRPKETHKLYQWRCKDKGSIYSNWRVIQELHGPEFKDKWGHEYAALEIHAGPFEVSD